MPRYIPIQGDSLVLVEQEIKVKKVVTKKGPVNHIWIYDRSGSMTWALPELTKQLIDLSKKLPKGDSLTLGWFSSEGGQYNWIFKGFRIVDNADYKMLETAIKKNSESLGCTCFSEILLDADTVIKDLSVMSKVFSLHFFTDGYPVVSNYKKEIDTIYSAVKRIKGRVHTAMFVGYGCGYNKELLTQMAEKLGAVLIHSSKIPEYANTITKLVQLTDNSEPKEEVEAIVNKPLSIFTVTDQGVVIYAPEEDGKLYVSPQKGSKTLIYYLSTEKPDKKNWEKIEVSSINFGESTDLLARAMYGAALVMSQQTKTDKALEVLGKIGDKKLINMMNSAFQVEEYGAAEEILDKAVQDVSQRFSEGRDINYLPPADAFCVFNVLDILLNDSEAAFFPYHPKFAYERIGVASKEKDEYGKFVADKTSKCPFTNLTWHENRLNLSVMTRVNGAVELKDKNGMSAQNLGLAVPYPTFVYRNFSFVKDGHTHIKVFYLTSSEATYKTFKNHGIITDDTFKSDKIYGLDISQLPAINRKIAEGKTSATDLCKAALQEHRLKAQIKALKYIKEQEIGEEEIKKPAHLTDAQIAFLSENGIDLNKGGQYSPLTTKEDPKDFYMAKSFEIALSGIASLPPVKKVQEKIASGKPRTPVESLVEEGIKTWESRRTKLASKDAKAQWFESTIKDMQNQMKSHRYLLQSSKFSVILGRRWFDEFSSRENCELTVDGIKCAFKLGEEKVPV